MNIEQKIEAILFFKNEPVSIGELSKLLNVSRENLQLSISNEQKEYRDRGSVLVTDGEEVSFGTHPRQSELIEKLQKEEFSRELGKAGLETLAVIAYRGPVSRREIDQIRGVNSGFILRTLLIRGLIERAESVVGERSFTYKPTLKLLEHLGVTSREDLPEFETAFKKVTEFVNSEIKESND